MMSTPQKSIDIPGSQVNSRRHTGQTPFGPRSAGWIWL